MWIAPSAAYAVVMTEGDGERGTEKLLKGSMDENLPIFYFKKQ